MSGTTAPRRRRRWLLLLAFVLVVAGLFQPALILAVLTNHRRGEAAAPASLVRQAIAAGGMEQIEFHAGDGLRLRGDLLGDVRTRPVVVFGHGYRDWRRQGDPLATELLARGYAVLLFDFRGSGASDGAFTGAGAIEAPDVRAALAHLERTRGVPPERTAYVGFSMGAAAGLLAAPALARLAAVVLIAPYTCLEETFEVRTRAVAGLPLRPVFAPALLLFDALLDVRCTDVRPVDHAALLAGVPLLVLGAADDWRVPPAGLREIVRRAGAEAVLEVLETGGHFTLARLGPEVRRPIVAFLTERLPPVP